MMWGSGLEDGNKHSRDNLPFVIAGKGGGTLKTRRFSRTSRATRATCSARSSPCRRRPAGPAVGIATKQLPELVASWGNIDGRFLSPGHLV